MGRLSIRRALCLLPFLLLLVVRAPAGGDAIDDYLRVEMQRRQIPGLALAVVRRGAVVKLGGYGFANMDPVGSKVDRLHGARDEAIPAWATRFFVWWSGLTRYELKTLPGAGHLLFHDHLDLSLPLVAAWLDERLGASAGGVSNPAVQRPRA